MTVVFPHTQASKAAQGSLCAPRGVRLLPAQLPAACPTQSWAKELQQTPVPRRCLCALYSLTNFKLYICSDSLETKKATAHEQKINVALISRLAVMPQEENDAAQGICYVPPSTFWSHLFWSWWGAWPAWPARSCCPPMAGPHSCPRPGHPPPRSTFSILSSYPALPRTQLQPFPNPKLQGLRSTPSPLLFFFLSSSVAARALQQAQYEVTWTIDPVLSPHPLKRSHRSMHTHHNCASAVDTAEVEC